MSTSDRESSRDRQNSFAESGRLPVPMWDSSDPDRAPPPLPLNPGSPSLTTRPNTSSNIQAAAAKLGERARESMPVGAYTTNSMNSSPEKSLIKGAQHRRMQSLQTGGVRDLRSYLDGMRSGSPERPSSRGRDEYLSSPERDPFTPTPLSSNKDPLKDTPSLKRPGPRPILGENTPPSSTMRALQVLAARDADGSLGDITNGRTPRNTEAIEDLSSQLQNLTNIASNLQHEMTQLSKRSKDNASDLISLKEATKNRDEDIRKNLRDLVNIQSPSLLGHSPNLNRSSSSFGLGLLDSKAFNSPPPAPRATSHHSLLDPGSPNPFSAEGAASIAMLEKIIREMGTKEGQERLLSSLSDSLNRSTTESVETSKKVTELAKFMKDKAESQALVRSTQTDGPPRLDLSFDTPSGGLSRSAEPMNAEMQKLLQKIKESVAGNGGMTAEVKALIRELRGEILGMGRELGKRLDLVDNPVNNSGALMDPVAVEAAKADMERVVREGIEELRQHMENLIEESGRQTMAITQSRDAPNGQEMYSVVKHALAEHGSELAQASQPNNLERDDILQAVKQACEDFKPEIELQQFGLERDEILQVLKEGLEGYQQSRDLTQPSAVNKDEIFEAIQEAVSGLALPQPSLDMHALREELIGSVRECLEDFKASPGGDFDPEATRDTINEALRTGLAEHGDQTSRVMEISREDLFEAVKAGLDGSTIPFGGFGEKVLQQLNELVDGMRLEFKQYSAANGRDTEQVLDAVKDGLETLRAQIENYVDRAQDVTGKDEIVDVVRTGLEQLRADVQGYVSEGPTGDRNAMLDYIKAEFEHLHTTIGTEGFQVQERSRGIDGEGSSEEMASLKEELTHLRETIAATLLKSGAAPDRDDILEAVREAAADMSSNGGSGISTEQLEAIHGEFQNLKQTMVTGGSRADFEEVLDTVRLGLDDLRSHVDKKLLDNPDRQMALSSDLLDALNDGLDTLRTDVTKTLEKPIDMTVNYEILETLKEGLAGLRSDMDKLIEGGGGRPASSNGGQIVLADDSPGSSRDVPAERPATAAADLLKRNDLEKMEVLLAQLQIKIEAMDANIQDMPAHEPSSTTPTESTGSAMKEDLVGMETMLREVQATVLVLAAREKAEVENAVTKDDTDAIETLLRNTKSQLEELASPDQGTLASKHHLDAVEEVLRSANDTLDDLATKIEESGATKADVAVIEVMVQDMKTTLDEIKEAMPQVDEDNVEEKLTKNDLDILGVICTEIKTKISEMELPDVETLPTRSDFEQITGLMNDFRDGHEKFRESYERDIGVTAKAFDDRKKDTDDIMASLADVKIMIDDTKEDTLAKVIDGELGVAALHEALKAIEEKVDDNPTLSADIKALTETVKNDFERAHESLDTIKSGREASDATMLEKHVEHKDLIISNLSEKLDAGFADLTTKHETSSASAEEKAAQQEELMKNTKEMADELKLSIDTLGTALTASTATLNEATEKIGEDFKTVFNRVDDTYNKLDETQEGLKAEHQATRDEVSKALDGISGLQGDFTEYHPRFMMSLKELHALVSQHYEHSQKLGETHADTLRSMADAQSEGFKTNGERHDELKSNLATGLSVLPALTATTTTTEPVESATRDDSAIHEKLDKLVEQFSTTPDSTLHEKLDKMMTDGVGAGNTSLQIERLDSIHQQVMATAAEVTAFVALQAQQITDGHESKEREAEEVGLILERRIAQKMQVETNITTLNDEKEALGAVVESLRAEKEALAAEKAKLNADVSSLHTALEIRREELHTMNNKADVLERRILEGLMNHSRSILLTKPKTPSPKKPKGRDLRIPSNASNVTVTSTVPSLKQSHALAMKSSRPPIRRDGIVPNSNERRIMSLGQISRNVASGGHGLSPIPSLVSSRPDSLKRSHSVKQPVLENLRKASLNSARNLMMQTADKENAGDLSEGSDDELSDRRSISHSYAQTHGTLSRGNSYYDSEGMTPYTDDGDRSSSYGTSMTYGTGSYMTGSEIDRRTSLASTGAGTIGGIDEEDESEVVSRPGSSHLDQDGGEHGAAGMELALPEEEGSRAQEQPQLEESKEMVLSTENNHDKGSSLGLDGAVDDVASEMFDPETGRMITQSEVEREVLNAIHEVHAKSSYAPPSDSGLGTDLPTAAFSIGSDGFFGHE